MKIHQLLTETSHRPWSLPQERWKFYQEWNNAIFLHWQVDHAALRKHVPPGLELDLYQGKAWVSVVAFTMENIRPRHLPPFSPISNFHEVNIRTYTHISGKAGVYFLSMEGSKWLSCKVAKGISQLPYRYSKMKRNRNTFESRNSAANDLLRIDYAIGKGVKEKNELDKWLTERYALHQDSGKSINEFEVHHMEWPVQNMDIEYLKISYPKYEKLLNGRPHLQHYSAGVQVLAWGKESILYENSQLDTNSKRLLISDLAQAEKLLSQLSGGYSSEYLAAEEFHMDLKQGIERLKKGDHPVVYEIKNWFAPTSTWDDFIGSEGEKLGNAIFNRVNNI